jgi:ABC-type Fe3+ transport system substrate-binding protein
MGVNPLVVVANLDEVGGRPLPARWEDVLDPRWENSLMLRGGAAGQRPYGAGQSAAPTAFLLGRGSDYAQRQAAAVHHACLIASPIVLIDEIENAGVAGSGPVRRKHRY